MRRNARTATRLGAYVATAGLAISGAILAVPPAQAVPDPTPQGQAADWLAGELDGGLMHNDNFGGFDDYGLSIDTGLALAAVGGHGTSLDQVSAAIAENINAYIGTSPNLYSGAAAKAAVLATVAGGNPANYGGVDLIQKIESTVSSTAPLTGRLEDKFDPNDQFGGDYANTLGQSFAANVLTDTSASKAGSVTSFLLEQQCSSGYFRLNFSPKGSSNQSCVDGTDTPDTDATAIAVLQLAQVSGDADVTAAVTRARSWLVAQQRCDGSFGGGASTEGSNANSTGLAAWALDGTPAARQAAVWLRAHQATPADSGNALAGEVGVIAYDDAGLAGGRTGGITDASRDQFRRATAQAAPGLASYSAAATPAISLRGPYGYQKAGSRTVLVATGAAPGTVVCLTGPGVSARGIAGSAGSSTTLTLPAGTRTRLYTARDAYGNTAATTVKVLGRANLSVLRSRYRVKRSRYVTATVRYLAPGEWARIFYKGRFVRSGHATSAGTFKASFRVGRAKGRKRITGYGSFTDIRRGTAVIRVVR